MQTIARRFFTKLYFCIKSEQCDEQLARKWYCDTAVDYLILFYPYVKTVDFEMNLLKTGQLPADKLDDIPVLDFANECPKQPAAFEAMMFKDLDAPALRELDRRIERFKNKHLAPDY